MEKQFEQLIEPKKFNYEGSEFYVGKIPAYNAQKIMLRSGDALKKFDMTKLDEETILELLSYSAVVNKGGEAIVLDSPEMVNAVIGQNTELLIAIEVQILMENYGFFLDGAIRRIFDPLIEKMAKAMEDASKQP